jgi:hypothetical protein
MLPVKVLPALVLSFAAAGDLASAPQALRPDVSLRRVVETGSGGGSIRLARDPTDGALYYLRKSGSIYRVEGLESGAASTQKIYAASDTGLSAPQGIAIGPEGNFYLTGNETQGANTVATVRRGERTAPGDDARVWATVARTEPYPRSNLFDHLVNGIAVSPDGRSLFVNSGARTDHGEEESQGGLFPGVREVALTAVMFRLPADGRDLVLRNDREFLRTSGYLFAEGLRNSFDPAFAPNGDLFAGENSDDRDDSEELNWIQEGRHYGFPWRIGTNDTPQQFAGYDPAEDLLLNHNYIAYQRGLFHDDPAYPPAPDVEFTEPVMNLGPDADSFRDPETGAVLDASALGITVGTFTAHRSPLGLVFDRELALGDGLEGDGFILSWTRGDPIGTPSQGPFADASEDLLHLELTKTGDAYRVRSTRIVSGFDHPIDAEIAGNRLYVLEYGGNGAVWEVTLPAAPPRALFRRGWINSDEALDLSDAVAALLYLFGGLSLSCPDAADVEDDGRVSVTDVVFLLRHLFLTGAAPPEPFAACGADPTGDAGGNDLGCAPGAGCG